MDTSHIVKQLSGWNYTGHVFGMFAFIHWRVPCWYFCCQLLFYDCPGSRLPKPSIYPDISAVSPTYLPRRWLTVYKSVTHLSFRNLTSRFSNGRSSPGEKENKIFIWRQATQVHTWEPHAGHRGGFSSSKIMPPLVLICESRQPGFHLFISCKRSLRIFFSRRWGGEGVGDLGSVPVGEVPLLWTSLLPWNFFATCCRLLLQPGWCVSRPTLTVCWRVL